MRKLTIGSDECRSVFRLRGKDEDALTYALGYLFTHDEEFLIGFLKEAGVFPRVSGKTYKAAISNATVKLQETSKTGRTDVVIESVAGLRVVIEAKIRSGQPDTCQLLRYTIGCRHRGHGGRPPRDTWREFPYRHIVSLTEAEPVKRTLSAVRKRLDAEEHQDFRSIVLSALTWEPVLRLVQERLAAQQHDAAASWMFDELQRFIQEDYEMPYYDVEVLIQDVSGLNAALFDECYLYKRDIKGPLKPLYVGAYKTGGMGGLTHVAQCLRVIEDDVNSGLVKRMEAELSSEPLFQERWKHWRTGLKQCVSEVRSLASPPRLRFFFLDEPQELPRALIKPEGLRQLSVGFNRKFLRLLNSETL